MKPSTDGDGCTDAQELGLTHTAGGDSDPLSPWDYYDVPVPALTIGDTKGHETASSTCRTLAAVLMYVGTSNGGPSNVHGVNYNTDLNGNGVSDGVEYDRTPSLNPAKSGRQGAPNGELGSLTSPSRLPASATLRPAAGPIHSTTRMATGF